MKRIAVTSDSTLALSQDQAKALGIYVLPLNVIIDNVEYHDGVDINLDNLNKMMRNSKARISTSTPTPYEIETFFDRVFADGYDEVVHFTISSKLSSMYDLFTMTCKEKYGDKIVVIDSRAVCTYMANNVLTALALVKEGKSKEEIREVCEKRRSDFHVFFIPESLTYLKNGGRISPAVALIGNLIGMKPILIFVDGEIQKSGTTRNLKMAVIDELKKIRDKKLKANDYEIHVVSFDTDAKTLEIVKKELFAILPEYEVKMTPLSINVAAHTGPGTIGVGIVRKINA